VGVNLRIFGITKPGLAVMAVAVAALWTCVGLEAATRSETSREAEASIRTLARLRRLTAEGHIRSTPARAPLPAFRVQRPFTS